MSSFASLSSEGAEATETSVSNPQIVHERLVSNQEFNSLEENDRQVILVKTDENPITFITKKLKPSGPSNFSTASLYGSRPSRSVPGGKNGGCVCFRKKDKNSY